MKVAAVGTWMGDFVTAWMVRNTILCFKRKRRSKFFVFQGKEERRREKFHFLKYSSISTQKKKKKDKWQSGRMAGYLISWES